MQRACSLYYILFCLSREGLVLILLLLKNNTKAVVKLSCFVFSYKTKRNIEAFSYFDVIV